MDLSLRIKTQVLKFLTIPFSAKAFYKIDFDQILLLYLNKSKLLMRIMTAAGFAINGKTTASQKHVICQHN